MIIVALEDIISDSKVKHTRRRQPRRTYCKASPTMTKRLRALVARIETTNALAVAAHRLGEERAALTRLEGVDGLRLGWDAEYLMFARARARRQVERLAKRVETLQARVAAAA